ncbi:hypothetical protein CRG98_048098 [Punica granatum]|uniref:Uncharacterized protein n=1 Tax=Punica granatum TaxID=22663 RepID=A0A2I0HII1_PUNGR|nr:hypothetical protein CRG98_048098 [Punica granatum]
MGSLDSENSMAQQAGGAPADGRRWPERRQRGAKRRSSGQGGGDSSAQAMQRKRDSGEVEMVL